MYIFFYLSILIFIVGIIFFIIGIKKEKQDLIDLEKSKRNYLEGQLQGIIKQCNNAEQTRQQLSLKCDAIMREYTLQTERLNDLRKQSHELLIMERERLQTEIDATRALKIEQLNNEYKAKKEVLEEDYLKTKSQIDSDIAACTSALEDFKNMEKAVNEAMMRQRAIEENETFYSIDVPKGDQEDIAVLQSMDARLHHRDVIPKLIWELFIRRPTQEMIKRVVGNGRSSGIYKITYKKTGEAYIGKTTDFSTRWQNHIKTTIGLEGAARATLHNRMAKDGLWNYTFEILERVDKESLSSREAYYIDLYGTKNQLNMKEGSKNGTQ